MKRSAVLFLFLLVLNCTSSKEYVKKPPLPTPGFPEEYQELVRSILLTSDDKNSFRKIKGDFKCIKLRDTEDIVMKKLKYISETDKKWKNTLLEYIFYNMKNSEPLISYYFGDFNTTVYFKYFENKLYKIMISFEREALNHYDTIIKNQYAEAIKLFQKKYGKSEYFKSISFSEKESHYIIYGAKWDFSGKIILVGVNYYKSKYNCRIYIMDDKLNKKRKLKTNFNNKQKPSDKVSDKVKEDF